MTIDPSLLIDIGFLAPGVCLIVFSLMFLLNYLTNSRIYITKYYQDEALKHFNNQLNRGNEVKNVIFSKPIELYWTTRDKMAKYETNSVMFFIGSGVMLIFGEFIIQIYNFVTFPEEYQITIILIILGSIFIFIILLLCGIKFTWVIYKEKLKISQ